MSISDTDTERHPAALHAARGGELLSIGDVAGAQACFQQALALDPDNVFALANLAWMREQEARWNTRWPCTCAHWRTCRTIRICRKTSARCCRACVA